MIIIDRFENEKAILETEDGTMEIMRCFLPPDAREGDVVIPNECGYTVDHYATEERRKSVRDKLHGLINKND